MSNTGYSDAMRRAFALAALGPKAAHNPQVGCVILADTGEVLAEGYHRGAGTPHAEVDALGKLASGAAKGATAVVSLEPCNHTGRTGPCAVALIDAGVSRVVYSVPDPGDASAGGAERLRQAGITVIADVERAAGEAALGAWLTAARLGRPVVSVKWAQSIDGRAAADDGTSQWITGPEARADVHRRRAEADAIAVGTGTVLADDPALSARGPAGLYPHQPIPVIFGRRGIPDTAKLWNGPHSPLRFDGDDLAGHLAALRASGVNSVFLEGGPTLASAFIRAGLVDELLVYVAPLLLGGRHRALDELGIGTLSDASWWTFDNVVTLGPDLLLRARRSRVG